MIYLTGSFGHLRDITSDRAFKIILANRIADSLSIAGCLFNLFTTLLLKASDYALGKMVVLLCVMDLIYNGVSIIQSLHGIQEWQCQATTFSSFFGFAGSLCCTICFAHALYISVTHANLNAIDSYLKIYLFSSCIAGSLAAILSVILGYTEVDEEVQLCLHRKPAKYGELIDWSIIILVLIPITFGMIICSICYLAIIRKLKIFNEKRSYLELFLYPLILVICYLPGSLKSIYENAADKNSPEGLDIAANALFNLQGFLNALVYGLSQRIMRGYKERLCKKTVASTEPVPGKNLSSIGSHVHDSSLISGSLISGDYEHSDH